MGIISAPVSGWLVLLISLQLFAANGVYCQSSGDVRLVDGPNPYEGRPELFYDGVWFSFCGSFVNSVVPQVICTQLGFPSAGAVKYEANSYGEAPGETIKRGFRCEAGKVSLFQCSTSGTGENCEPRYTLGVSCNTTTSATEIRLQNGSSPYEGRLEVFLNGVWGTVCRSFSESYVHHAINAHVACRELFGTGYGGVNYPAYETPSRFGILQSGAIHIQKVWCNGDEDSLLNCSSSSAVTDNTCNHEKDATIKCVPVPEGCGGYFKAETGSVTSPGYPTGHNYIDDTECVWKIETTAGRQIDISFSDVRAHETNTANFIKVIGSNGYSAYRTSYGSAIADYVDTANVVYIRQKTVAGHVGIDFRASWGTAPINCNSTYTGGDTIDIQSVGYSNNYPPGLDCYYLVQYREQFTASVDFSGFHLDDEVNGTCQDYVEIFDGATISDTSLGRFCNATRPPTLTSQNVVLIHFHSDDVIDDTSGGFHLSVSGFEPDPVFTTLTGASGTLASPGYPDTYTHETDYEWIITVLPYNSVTLNFLDFEISCSFSTLLVIQDGHPSGKTLASPCGTGVPTPVMSNTNVMYLRLQSAPGVTSGNRFNATWEAECRRTFTSNRNAIVSPEYPSPYPDNLDCVYIITMRTGYYIKLTFTAFTLDSAISGECHDFVEVRDGSSEYAAPLNSSFCETSVPFVVMSSGNSMWIKFHSDDVSNSASTGFEANYVGYGIGCESQTLTSNQGSFTSPAYPLQYHRYTFCVWKITVPNSYIVELTFHDFAIGRKDIYDCSGSYVRVYDGDSVDAYDSPVLATLCGTTVLPHITSTGRSLTVVLNSFDDSPAEAIGFNASYRASAVAVITQYDLFPFGEAENDNVLDQSDSATGHMTVQDGFPFGDGIEYDVYIGTNGLVSIGNNYTWPELPDSRQVICVYCAFIDNTDSVGGIYYHLYGAGANDTDVLQKASEEVQEYTESDTFNATMVLVVTWDRVRQGRYRLVNFNPQDEGEATFQLALIFDRLTSYALVYYASGAMTWTYMGHWSYVIMGVSDGSVDNYQPNVYTKTETAYRIDTVPGNTGRVGTWLYKVGEVPAIPQDACSAWFQSSLSLISDRMAGFSTLPECPCSHRDVWRKTRYLWVKTRTDHAAKVECYRMNRASSSRYYPYGKECCYSTDSSDPLTYQQLIMYPPYAGHALAYNPSYWHLKEHYEREDKEGYDACCDPSASPFNCFFFYSLRPIGDCRAQIPFRFSMDACSSGAVCGQHEQCSEGYYSFSCSCLTGYQNVNGTCTDIDECAANIDDCQHRCVNVDGSYNCDCNYGYRLNSDRTTCSQMSDPCAEEENLSCDHGCTLNSAGRAVCFCDTGYRLQTDKQTCTDIDECSRGIDRCSHWCRNTVGSFTCSCPLGKRLGFDKKTCLPCPEGTFGIGCQSSCTCNGEHTSSCDHASGSCVCKPGWQGVTCSDDVNECQSSPCGGHGTCSNTEGSHLCSCDTGYTQNRDGVCTDIDECSAGNHRCSHKCTNTDGGFTCSCPPGMMLDNADRTCITCPEGTFGDGCTQTCDCPGQHVQSCDNVDGTCRCEAGWEGSSCDDDRDECASNNLNDCSDTDHTMCQNTVGGFTCVCQKGFAEDSSDICIACPEGTFGDGCTQTCDCPGQHVQSCDNVDGTCRCEAGWEGSSCDDDVDECASDNLNDCSDTDHTMCQNTVGGFTCVCQEGFAKDSSDVCIDIDECSAGIDRCSHTCTNTDGGFTCSCPPGMMLDNDGKTCVTCPEGSFGDGCTQTCDCSGQHVQSCDHVDGTCRCEAGWEGSSCDDDVDECASDNLNDCSDTDHTVCQNTVGGFTCVCQEGFKNDSNDVCIAVSRLPFTVVIHVTLPTADLSSEPSRSTIQRQVQDMIFTMLRRFVDRLMAVEVRSLRAGSVIVAADAVVPSDTVRSSAASLSVALLDITGLNVAVAGQTGPVGTVVGDSTVSAQTTLCDVFTNYVTCEDSQACQVMNNVPDCRDQVLGDEKLLALVIGLAVGIPCFIVTVCIVLVLCYRHSKSKRQTEYEENNLNKRDANKFSNQHPLDAPEGNLSFPHACRMHAHQ